MYWRTMEIGAPPQLDAKRTATTTHRSRCKARRLSWATRMAASSPTYKTSSLRVNSATKARPVALVTGDRDRP